MKIWKWLRVDQILVIFSAMALGSDGSAQKETTPLAPPIPYYVEAPAATSFPITIFLNENSPGKPITVEGFMDKFYGEWKIQDIRQKILRNHLTVDELLLDDSIIYSVLPSEHFVARAFYDANGQPNISVTSGLLRDLDFLIQSWVLGHKYAVPICLAAYQNYLISAIKQNIASQDSGKSLSEIIDPETFTQRNKAVCPVITQKDLDFSYSNEQWAQEYWVNSNVNLAFVLLHEFAHFKLNTVGPVYSPTESKDNELKADRFALDKIAGNPASTIAILPLIYVYQSLEGEAVEGSDHPSPETRKQLLFDVLWDRLKDPTFKKKFEEEHPGGFKSLETGCALMFNQNSCPHSVVNPE